jgi:hypothetical protein
MPLKPFHKLEWELMLGSSFYEASVTPTPKLNNNTIKKKTNFLDIDVRIFNKILVN